MADKPIEFTVTCGGERHRLRIDGDIVMADHPDVENERVLISLGGDPPECIRVSDAWTRACSNAEYGYSIPATPARGLHLRLPPEPATARPALPAHRELYDQAWTHALVRRLPGAASEALAQRLGAS